MGVSRKCVKTWIDRFDAEGEAGLVDRSSRPHDHDRREPALRWRPKCWRRGPASGSGRTGSRPALAGAGKDGDPDRYAVTRMPLPRAATRSQGRDDPLVEADLAAAADRSPAGLSWRTCDAMNLRHGPPRPAGESRPRRRPGTPTRYGGRHVRRDRRHPWPLPPRSSPLDGAGPRHGAPAGGLSSTGFADSAAPDLVACSTTPGPPRVLTKVVRSCRDHSEARSSRLAREPPRSND